VSCLSGPPVAVRREEGWGAAVKLVAETWTERLEQVTCDRPDLIVLPEVCDRPVAISGDRPFGRAEMADYYRERGDSMRDLFSAAADEHHCLIAYSAIREDDQGRLWNSTQLLGRDGAVIGAYDKNHLVIEENSESGICYADAMPIFETDLGRVACAICFDLNFDELRDQCAAARPDLILFSSMYHGSFVQQQWAYSARAYLASAICSPAPSAVISPVGEILASSTNYFSRVTTRINLDYVVIHLDYNRAKFPAIKAKYGPAVDIHDPGLLGSVLLTSESEEITAADVVAEFELELLDDYFARARAHRRAHL
jgi:predicted amidohydrolase